MADEDGEKYLDVVKGEVRPRRGKRKIVNHGPYSLEEQQAIDAWRAWLSAQRDMHGILAQATCRDFTLFMTRAVVVMRRYSYENFPDVSGVSPHAVMEELEFDLPESVADDTDVYKGLQLSGSELARLRRRCNAIFCVWYPT